MITTEVIIGARRFIRDSSPQSCLATSSLTLHLNIISRSRSSSSTTISPAHYQPARSRYPSAKTSVVCVWYCEQWFSVTLSAFYLILHFGHENPLSFVCTGKIFVHFANCSMNVLSDMPPLGQNPLFDTIFGDNDHSLVAHDTINNCFRPLRDTPCTHRQRRKGQESLKRSRSQKSPKRPHRGIFHRVSQSDEH